MKLLLICLKKYVKNIIKEKDKISIKEFLESVKKKERRFKMNFVVANAVSHLKDLGMIFISN